MQQIFLSILIFILLVIPVGIYLYKVYSGMPMSADFFFNWLDNIIFRLGGLKKDEMTWKQYAAALLLTNALMALTGYLILRVQSMPLLNPNGMPSLEANLSFHTVISFITNTDLQHYSGESSLSYLSQMIVITYFMFTSAATGCAAGFAFIRGLTGVGQTMGNFYVDLVRVITRVLLPLSFFVGLALVSQGVPQNISANITVNTIEGRQQDIAMGPIASLESIKHLGNNGGGFLGANSAAPQENPNILSNMIELFSMMILPGALVVVFGLSASERRKKYGAAVKSKSESTLIGGEGRTFFIAMLVIMLVGASVLFWAESAGNPALEKAGLNQSMGNMEGKEVRFGLAQSSLFAAVTTAFSTGTVNSMHDSLTPLGGLVALVNMMMNAVFGAVGVGFMNMATYAILAVFLCGLMVGRTPAYLGKKIEGREMKLMALCIIIHPFLILSFSALAMSSPDGLKGISNPGFHGFSQILYEYSSAAANNGSNFAGLGNTSFFWNTTTGLVMFYGRYVPIIFQLALAGSLMKKTRINESIGTLKTDTLTFAVTLVLVLILFSALTFFPALSLGPIAEHLTLWN